MSILATHNQPIELTAKAFAIDSFIDYIHNNPVKVGLSIDLKITHIVALLILRVRKEWSILNHANSNQLQTTLVFSPSYTSLNLNYAHWGGRVCYHQFLVDE